MEFPAIQATLENAVPTLLISIWQEMASSHVDTGFYSSFTTFERMFPYQGDNLSVAVANTAPHARVLEVGHSGFHLPSVIDWGSSAKAHVSARGVRYLRIPFRHGTPGSRGVGSGRARTMMSRAVYEDAKIALRGDRTRREARLAAERLMEAGTRMSRPYSHMFPYSGDARTAQVVGQLRQRALQREGAPGYTWRARTYEGLKRIEQTNPQSGRSSGVYMTFRTLSEDSVGWMIPPMAGFGFAKKTVDAARGWIRELVAGAAREDVVRLLQVQVGNN